MRPLYKSRLLVACFVCSVAVANAQQTQSTAPLTAVPRLVRFTGSFHPPAGQPAGMIGATLAVYGQQEGGTPLWTEDQNVELDASGNYTVLLGSTKNGGVPLELFAVGESRWLQVKFYAPGEVDLPRVLLVSVPYALKAGDADTLGGKPASAFLLVGSSSVVQPAAAQPVQSPGWSPAIAVAAVEPAATTPDYIARFTSTAGAVGNSVMYQKGSNIGVGTKTPGARLEVNGNAQVDGGSILASGSAPVIQFPANGLNNFSAGLSALPTTTTGNGNTAIGDNALQSNTTGNTNTAIGSYALQSNTTGNQNNAYGFQALQSNTTGFGNAANGFQALYSNTLANYNVADGFRSMYSNTTGIDNVGVGEQAMYSNTTGYSNFAGGSNSMYSNTTGYSNTAVGEFSLYSNVTGYGNTAIGTSACQGCTSNSNTAVGNLALSVNTTYENTGIGQSALGSTVGGFANTCIGYTCLYGNTTGEYNSAVGANAGRYIANGSSANAASTYSVYLGYNAMAKASGDTNEVVIGYNAIGNGSNTGVLGNASVTDVYFGGAGAAAIGHSAGYVGPATAPSGACSTNGVWVFSQDGHATVCLAATWVSKI